MKKQRRTIINTLQFRYNPITKKLEDSFNKGPEDLKEMYSERLVKLRKNQISRRIEATI